MENISRKAFKEWCSYGVSINFAYVDSKYVVRLLYEVKFFSYSIKYTYYRHLRVKLFTQITKLRNIIRQVAFYGWIRIVTQEMYLFNAKLLLLY